MTVINSSMMYQLVPHYHGKRGARQYHNILAIGPFMPATLSKFHIDTPLRQAHFLAQICEESFGLSDMKEEASGAEYEGRAKGLGNTHRGDGVRYKGRGLIQLTGRRNYAKVGHELGLDLVNHPEVAESPQVALEIACQFWMDHHLNFFADHDDLEGVTRRINGKRMLGLEQRRIFLAKAKRLLGV